ncbi:proline--tRNA ligase [Echria macrotheca]|uniref:proline--tRNA ligase n=1 Tax=Echria macrotheca TaxID=438768 RepID=A0AAJ0BFY8_9PEZI|nr:proline--tRNA ligase [Echria macrotheca]
MVRPLSRLSRLWLPTGGIAAPEGENAHSKLIRAGYLRQSHSGIFQMLPLGLRVQDKIERLIVRHMEGDLAASRVSLSSLSSEALWEKSGRLQNVASELFRLSDRKDTAYLLAPTHEEEITTLVARTVKSHKTLPLRLYQITRKYRDEFRPRHGLLRGREFVMKDLYTFDHSLESALETYQTVRAAYSRIFAEMKLPILAAKASSGDMGGDLSHEYHLPSPIGDDHVIHCNSCAYVINEEIANMAVVEEIPVDAEVGVWRGITTDRSTLVNVWYPRRTTLPGSDRHREYDDGDVSISAVKSIIPNLDASVADPVARWMAAHGDASQTATKLMNLVDSRLPTSFSSSLKSGDPGIPLWPRALPLSPSHPPVAVYDGRPRSLLRARTGDRCPECSSGVLTVEKAIELGHTFHLGTRYSDPLGANIAAPSSNKNVPMQMGCHGIGVSRIIGAVSEHLADEAGLNWPVVIAPYSCVIIPDSKYGDGPAVQVYEMVSHASKTDSEILDLVVDDRKLPLPWRMKDADLVGYPIVIILGKEWGRSQKAEVQCRRLGVRELVSMDDLPGVIDGLHAAL